MRIEIETYTLIVSEKELWMLTSALAHKLQNPETIKHCAFHNGMDTFYYNYDKYDLPTYKTLCTGLQRPELYSELIREVENKIEEEIEKNKARVKDNE